MTPDDAGNEGNDGFVWAGRNPALPHYRLTEEQASDGSAYWLVWEGSVCIAYCDTKAYALAITQALNTARATLAGVVLKLAAPPAEMGLN